MPARRSSYAVSVTDQSALQLRLALEQPIINGQFDLDAVQRISNTIINGKMDYNIHQWRVFLSFTQILAKHNFEVRQYRLKIADLYKGLDIKSKNIYSIFHDEQILRGIMTITIKRKNADALTGDPSYKKKFKDNKSYELKNFFQSIHYDNPTGSLILIPSPDAIPIFSAITSHFTPFHIRTVLSLSSQNSIRMYLLLQQFRSLQKRNLYFADFRWKFSVSDKYSNYDMKKWILNPCQKELKSIGFEFTYEYWTKDGKPIGFEFKIVKNNFENKVTLSATKDTICQDVEVIENSERPDDAVEVMTSEDERRLLQRLTEPGENRVSLTIPQAIRVVKSAVERYGSIENAAKHVNRFAYKIELSLHDGRVGAPKAYVAKCFSDEFQIQF